MTTVYLQGWIEDDQGHRRHDGWRVYTTRTICVMDTDWLEGVLNGPVMVSVKPDGPPFAREVSTAVFNKALEHEGYFVTTLKELDALGGIP